MFSICIYSCSSDDNNRPEEDYLIFGHFYGMCFGDGCVLTYKLTDDTLFKDAINSYSGTDFDFAPMAEDNFEAVNDLMDYFPQDLLEDNRSTFGCPDCADQGGLFIEYSKNGKVQTWRIDQSKRNSPEYLHPFMDKVNEKINLIYN